MHDSMTAVLADGASHGRGLAVKTGSFNELCRVVRVVLAGRRENTQGILQSRTASLRAVDVHSAGDGRTVWLALRHVVEALTRITPGDKPEGDCRGVADQPEDGRCARGERRRYWIFIVVLCWSIRQSGMVWCLYRTPANHKD